MAQCPDCQGDGCDRCRNEGAVPRFELSDEERHADDVLMHAGTGETFKPPKWLTGERPFVRPLWRRMLGLA